MNAGSQKGKPFQQPLHMRVVTPVGLQPEGLGDFLVLLPELGAEAPEEPQFLFVIFLQARINHGHRGGLKPRTSRC